VAPFQQGDLDGLCAIYACINAAKLITGRLGHEKGRELFLDAAVALAKRKRSIEYITEGTNSIDITCILRDIICPEFNIIRSKPFHKRSEVSTVEFWQTARRFLDQNNSSSILINLETWDYAHWTVINRISTNQIFLYDSSRRKIINRKFLSTIDITDTAPILIHPTLSYFLKQR